MIATRALHPQPVAPSVDNAFGARFVAPLALGGILNPINSTMIATALVPIATSFHASAAEAAWLIAGLYLASAVAQPTMGRLADLFGARRIYLIALSLVALAGVLGPIAPSLVALVLVRVLLGVGTSGAYPAAMRLFRTQADRVGAPPPRAAMGILSMTALSSSALGPVLGGALTDRFGWHAIFAVNTPLALIAIATILTWVPKDTPAAVARPSGVVEAIDFPGITLFAALLLSLMGFLMSLRSPHWWALALALPFTAALVVHSRRRADPFIDVGMLARNLPLSATYLRAGVVSMFAYTIIYAFAQWLESAAHFTGTGAGLVMLPLLVVASISSLVGARTKGIRGPFIVSVAAPLVGCVGFSLLHAGTPGWALALAGSIFGLPLGLFSSATQAAIYVQAPPKEIGTAAGLQRTGQYIGAIAAASLLGLVFGQQATDASFHTIALIIGSLSAVLLVVTIFDRTIPRGRV